MDLVLLARRNNSSLIIIDLLAISSQRFHFTGTFDKNNVNFYFIYFLLPLIPIFFLGNANSSLSHDRPFTTRDRDNDHDTKHNCAITFKGAWWYSACHASNLNGLYLRGNHSSYADGVNWKGWKGYHYSLKRTEMKIRPVNF